MSTTATSAELTNDPANPTNPWDVEPDQVIVDGLERISAEARISHREACLLLTAADRLRARDEACDGHAAVLDGRRAVVTATVTTPRRIRLSRARGFRLADASTNPNGVVNVARPSRAISVCSQVLGRPSQKLRIIEELAQSLVAQIAQGAAIYRRAVLVIPPKFLAGSADLTSVEHDLPEFGPALSLPLLRPDARVLVATPSALAGTPLDEAYPGATGSAVTGLAGRIDVRDPMAPLDLGDEAEFPVSAESRVADQAVAASVSGLFAPIERTEGRR